MPDGGKACDADLCGIDAVVLRVEAHVPERALRVEQRHGVLIVLHVPVAQHECDDTLLIEPAGNVLALMRGREPAVAAARTDRDGAARGPATRRVVIDRDGGGEKSMAACPQ